MTIKSKVILQVALLCLVLGSMAAYLFYGNSHIKHHLKTFSPATRYLIGIADVQLGMARELRTIWGGFAAEVPLDYNDLVVHQEEIGKAFDLWVAAAREQQTLGVEGEAEDIEQAETLRQLYAHWQQQSREILESGQSTEALAGSARMLLEDQLFPGLESMVQDGVDEVNLAYLDLEDALSFFPWLQTSARQRIRMIEADLDFVIGGNKVYTLLNRQFAALHAYKVNRHAYDLSRFQAMFEDADRALLEWHHQAVKRLGLNSEETGRSLDLKKVSAAQESYALLRELAGNLYFNGDPKDRWTTVDVVSGQIEGMFQASLRPVVMASLKSGINSVHAMSVRVNQFGMFLLVILMLVIIVQALRSVRTLLGSLRVLQFGIETFQTGNLAHRVPIRGDDEIAQLGVSLNLMVERLGGKQQEIEDLNTSLERKVAERTRMLEEVNQEMHAFNHMVSHDLRNPLSAVLGLGQALLDKAQKNGSDDQVPLSHVVAGAERVDKKITALLSLSQIAYQPLRYDAIDLTGIAAQVFAELQLESPLRKARLKADNALKVAADPELLTLVIENLVQNAWKYSASEQSLVIEVASCETERGKTYYVQDNGPGFSLAEAGNIFAPFNRLDSNGDIAGAGIGLALVERIIHRHGGDIWVESTPGTGSSFFFTLGDPIIGDG